MRAFTKHVSNLCESGPVSGGASKGKVALGVENTALRGPHWPCGERYGDPIVRVVHVQCEPDSIAEVVPVFEGLGGAACRYVELDFYLGRAADAGSVGAPTVEVFFVSDLSCDCFRFVVEACWGY